MICKRFRFESFGFGPTLNAAYTKKPISNVEACAGPKITDISSITAFLQNSRLQDTYTTVQSRLSIYFLDLEISQKRTIPNNRNPKQRDWLLISLVMQISISQQRRKSFIFFSMLEDIDKNLGLEKLTFIFFGYNSLIEYASDI